jgi:hypothetical protein
MKDIATPTVHKQSICIAHGMDLRSPTTTRGYHFFPPFFQRYPPRSMKHRGVLHSISYSAAPLRYIYFYSGGNGSEGRDFGSGDDAAWQSSPSLTSTTDF